MTIIAVCGIIALAVSVLRWHDAGVVAACLFVLIIALDIAHFSLPYNATTIAENKLYPRPQVLSLLPDLWHLRGLPLSIHLVAWDFLHRIRCRFLASLMWAATIHLAPKGTWIT